MDITKINIKKLTAAFAVAPLMFMGVLYPHAAKAAGTQQILINEINWSGSTASPNDTWIELYNPGQASVDIQGWTISHIATSAADFVLPTGSPLVIGANNYFLISHFDQNNQNSILNTKPDYVSSDVELSTTCEPIQLLNNDATPQLIDEVGCNGSSYFAGSNLPHRSMERTASEGDGTVASSWQSSIGHGNLVDGTADFATPKIYNDPSAPLISSATVQVTSSSSQITASWSGFTDEQTGIARYLVGLGTTPNTADIIAFAPTTELTDVFSTNNLTVGTNYYVIVKAINGAGIESSNVASSAVRLTTIVLPPTNISAVDNDPNYNVALHVSWNPSTSLNIDHYIINYRLQNAVSSTPVNAGNVTDFTINNLPDVTYEVTVQAVDTSGNVSSESQPVLVQSVDIIPPVVDASRITLNQNPPGSEDSIQGSAGAVTEPNSLIKVYDRNPNDPLATLIGSVSLGSDGSFPPLLIGDNAYSSVWLVAVDAAGNITAPYQFMNDIVSPNAPILERLSSNCTTQTCQVNLQWSAVDSAVTYQVGYQSGGVKKFSGTVNSTSLLLGLPLDGLTDFWVVALDSAGNISANSNVLGANLRSNLQTISTFNNGQTHTSFHQLTQRAVAFNRTTTRFIPKANAAEPMPIVQTPTETPNTPAAPTPATNGQEWIRILVVAILLLIVAAGFYALSRSFVEPDEVKKSADTTPSAPAKRGRGRPRKNPVAPSNQPKRPRGRPRKQS